jgi:hypothetical protein
MTGSYPVVLLFHTVNLERINIPDFGGVVIWTMPDWNDAAGEEVSARAGEEAVLPFSSTQRPTPCTLHPASCILHPTPYTLHPAPYTLHPTPYTLHRQPYTLNRTGMTRRARK